jgi:FAD:protein FMN transferase
MLRWWFALGALSFPCCSLEPPRRHEFAAEHMGTTFRIVLYERDPAFAREVADEAFRTVDELDATFSDYDPLSEVSRLCALSRERAPTEWRVLSEPLYRVLLESRWLAEDSGGAFDVTVGPFTQLWRRTKRQGELPAPERIAAARSAIGYDKLELDPVERSARLHARDMKIDLGGIAVGFTLDLVMARLRDRGIESALVDGGGDVIVSAPPPGEPGWRIALDDMLRPSTAPGNAILLRDGAVTTSGDGWKYVMIGGVRYGHIVDKTTGLGSMRRVAAVVIAKTALDADALATTCCLLEVPAALALLAKRGAEGRIVEGKSSSAAVAETPGFAARVLE